MTVTDNIRIYVACLAAYNNAILHGRWIDATQGVEYIRNEIAEMLKRSPVGEAEEYAIHDYEGFKGLKLSEWETPETVADLAEFASEHGELGAALVEHFGCVHDATRAIEECYLGEYESLEEYAREYVETTITVPELIDFYIDFKSMGADMAINDVLAIELRGSGVHLFSYP